MSQGARRKEVRRREGCKSEGVREVLRRKESSVRKKRVLNERRI